MVLSYPQVIDIEAKQYTESESMKSAFWERRQHRPFEALLFTTKESRAIAQKHLYPLYFDFPRTYFNPLVDTLVFKDPFEFDELPGHINLQDEQMGLVTSLAMSASVAHRMKSSTFTLELPTDMKIEALAKRLQTTAPRLTSAKHKAYPPRPMACTFPNLKELLLFKDGRILSYAYDGHNWSCNGYHTQPSTQKATPAPVPVPEQKDALMRIHHVSLEFVLRTRVVREDEFEKQDRIRTAEILDALGESQPELGLQKAVLDAVVQKKVSLSEEWLPDVLIGVPSREQFPRGGGGLVLSRTVTLGNPWERGLF